MRFKLCFNLENKHFPIQYRKSILSFIKKSLSEYNLDYYEKFYHKRDNIIKPYTFAVFFNRPEFEKEGIILHEKRFEVNFSVEDMEIGIILFNSFNHQRNKKFPLNQNSWTLQNIVMMMEKEINKEELQIKFCSPLVVRERQNQKDYYYSFKHEKFLETLRINVKEQLKITDIPKELVDTLELIPTNPKKTVIKFYEQQIEASLGEFQIKGDNKLLKYLYQAGLGSRHSAGFGMFEII